VSKPVFYKDDDTVFVQCDCHAHHYLQVWKDYFGNEGDLKFVHFMLVGRPHTLRERLKGAWRALRGQQYSISDDVIVRGSEWLPDLVAFLQEDPPNQSKE
jgi:hypothetical protein